jgi:hypothetical protein
MLVMQEVLVAIYIVNRHIKLRLNKTCGSKIYSNFVLSILKLKSSNHSMSIIYIYILWWQRIDIGHCNYKYRILITSVVYSSIFYTGISRI